MKSIETARLILRPWREDDAADLYKYAKDPLVGPPAGWKPHENQEESLRVLQNILMDGRTWAITLKGSDEPIGSIGLFGSDVSLGSGEPELGYWLARPFWGRGIVPEAAAKLIALCFEKGHERVWCSHFQGNDKSRRVIEKCGFEYRCTEAWEVPAFNETRQALYYSILRKEEKE